MKRPHPRTTRLIDLMKRHQLKIKDVARMMNRSRQTIRAWRCGARVIPEYALRVLEVKIQEDERNV